MWKTIYPSNLSSIDYSFRALLLFNSSIFFFFCFKPHWNWQKNRTDFVVLVLVCYKIRQTHFSADPLADEKALGLLGDHSCLLLHFTHHYWSPAECPPWNILSKLPGNKFQLLYWIRWDRGKEFCCLSLIHQHFFLITQDLKLGPLISL